MKKLVLMFGLVAFAASFTSCKKCGRCVEAGFEGSEICKDDVGQILYKATKDACKEDGGTWEE